MLSLLTNIITKTDSYKLSQYLQYPRDARYAYAYLESRGGPFEEEVVFGYTPNLIQNFAGRVVTTRFIDEAERLHRAHMGGPFNRRGWEYIRDVHSGRLPLRIKAVPEGTVIAPHNVIMTVENTDPEVPWLTGYAEPLLLHGWYPMTVASQSRMMAKTILASLERTGDPSLLPFKLHDFGFRGVTCPQQAAIGAAAHLVTFQGTDTLAGIDLIEEFYTARRPDLYSALTLEEAYELGRLGLPLPTPRERYGADFEMPGFSIPASEHSTITSWGRDHELDACRNMLEQFPTGLVACVSDSYDIFNCCENIWGGELRDLILKRDGCLVVRPDSGDPHVVVPRVQRILADKLGYTVNSKGYIVLNPKIRVIQGDGIDRVSVGTILEACEDRRLSTDNLAFGSGGGLLQAMTRDTGKFAFKCCAIDRAGVWHDVVKSPVTDKGKASKGGRKVLITDPKTGEFRTVREDEYLARAKTVPAMDNYSWGNDHLRVVFENGSVLNRDTFAQIRARAALKPAAARSAETTLAA